MCRSIGHSRWKTYEQSQWFRALEPSLPVSLSLYIRRNTFLLVCFNICVTATANSSKSLDRYLCMYLMMFFLSPAPFCLCPPTLSFAPRSFTIELDRESLAA